MTTPTRAIERLTSSGQLFEMREVPVAGGVVRAWTAGVRTLREVVTASAAYGDARFLSLGEQQVTFAEHLRAVATLSRHFVTSFGVQPGERVAIAMRNLPEWSVAFWATVSIGAVAVPLNAWWTGEELAFALGDSGARIVLADEERARRLADVTVPTVEHTIVVRSGRTTGAPSLAAVLEAGAGSTLPSVELDEDCDATLFYTSGTTGPPKGALGTHRNMVSNLLSRRFYRELDSLVTGRPYDATPGTTLLTVPLFHATGSHSYLLPALAAGSRLVLMPKWDVGDAIGIIERERVTAMGGVPFMALQLLDAYRPEVHDLSSLTTLAVGGAVAPASLAPRLATSLPAVVPGNGYGMTETSSTAIYNYGEEYRRRPEAIGRVVPIMDARIVDEQGQEVTSGRTGELWLRGANVVRGYWQRPAETAASFLPGGWLRTGDLATRDGAGIVTLVGRAKDIIIRGGENIAPAEVEAVLLSHPAVLDAAVVGVPHDLLGEAVAAVVQMTDPGAVDVEDVRRHVGLRLAAFKVPTRVVVTTEPLPRSPQGKLVRSAVLRFLGPPVA